MNPEFDSHCPWDAQSEQNSFSSSQFTGSGASVTGTGVVVVVVVVVVVGFLVVVVVVVLEPHLLQDFLQDSCIYSGLELHCPFEAQSGQKAFLSTQFVGVTVPSQVPQDLAQLVFMYAALLVH